MPSPRIAEKTVSFVVHLTLAEADAVEVRDEAKSKGIAAVIRQAVEDRVKHRQFIRKLGMKAEDF